MSFVLRSYRAPDFARPELSCAPDARTLPAPADGVAPAGYHATTIYPEYFRVGGRWLLAADSRMDCVAVLRGGAVEVVEFRNLRAGDAVFLGRREDGSEGVYVHADGFASDEDAKELFAFRQGRSRETAFSGDYDALTALLRHERDHGNILWVMGPACAFDRGARDAFARLVDAGYCHALLAGNALATHDLEAAWLGTALGQDVYTHESRPLGHYNHLDTLNRVRACGSIPRFIEEEGIRDGIIHACVKKGVPFVLAGSIRDDGPMPEIFGDVYRAQDAMRARARRATTVIAMASALHSIAVGNMTPSYRVLSDGTVREVYFYVVDVSEFAVNKLADRGSLAARGIVTNAQDFVVKLAGALCVP